MKSPYRSQDRMGPARKDPPSHPGGLPELHAMNSLYSSARSQQERAADASAREASPVARLRIQHYEDKVAMKNRHTQEVNELQVKHHKQRTDAAAKRTSWNNVGPGAPVAHGRLASEQPELERLAKRHEQEREKQAASHTKTMEAALKLHGHAK
jgi:galactose-1-phosphate uridylyltransferase